jgi:outer membrane protein assembly factor BamA
MRIFFRIKTGLTCYFLFFILLIFNHNFAFGINLPDKQPDSTGTVVIHSIQISGNLRTRSSIILRELSFHEKDTIWRSTFIHLLDKGKENIFNTSLFNFVTVESVPSKVLPEQTDVLIHVIERWYIWPWPFFEISDRNFNTWAETAEISRLTYGIDLTIRNVGGLNETLKFPVHYGFNQKIGFSYRIPYLDRKKTTGIEIGAEFNRNHEVIIETVNNKTVFYKDPENFPRQNFYAWTELFLRATFYARHTFRFFFNSWTFSDSLLKIPGYSPGTSNHLRYFSLFYQYRNDHRDVQFYPLKGFYFDIDVVQNGLWYDDVNEFYIKTNFRKFFQLFSRWYFASGLTGKLTLTPHPSYLLQRGLGYGREFVRGYEYYVIDGKDFLLWKNNLKFAIIPLREFDLDFIRSQKFNKVPYALYLDLFCDLGYVYYDGEQDNNSNTMRNSLLIGTGAGLDFTTYYDIVIRLEAAVNKSGTPGIYLHFTAPI